MAKKELESMRIEKGDKGGAVVTHHYKSQPIHRSGVNGGMSTEYVEPEKFIFGKSEGKKLTAHISSHLGLDQASASAPHTED